MSRKCPKRNYLFINWLKVNRNRFIAQPYIARIRYRSLEISFKGLPPTIKICHEFTASNGPWITVDIVRPDEEREGIIRFYGAEIKTEKGWTSLALRTENIRYWPTREDLWTDLCFEEFLKWFNKEFVQYK